jgi:hypothetical protein
MAAFPSRESAKSPSEVQTMKTVPRCAPSYFRCQVFLNPFAQAILDPKTSRKVFELAKEQQDELSMPDDADNEPAPRTTSTSLSLSRPRHAQDSDEDEEDEDLDYIGVADIEYEEEFVSAVGVSVLSNV